MGPIDHEASVQMLDDILALIQRARSHAGHIERGMKLHEAQFTRGLESVKKELEIIWCMDDGRVLNETPETCPVEIQTAFDKQRH